MREAMFAQQNGATVSCGLCAHACQLTDGQRGLCGVRQNHQGQLVSLVYGRLIAAHVDPIEKKPLYHLLPGSRTYSIATPGCNFRCRHCQNHQISQVASDFTGENLPETTAAAVLAAARAAGCQSLSCTYTEPTVFYEFACDCCQLARQAGLATVFVSNGYLSAAAARQLAPVLTAINIDIKAGSDAFYRKVCGARLQPVLDSVRRFKELGVWVEVTTLLIPGYNNDERELRALAAVLAAIDPQMPWHLSAFHPCYQLLDAPPTPAATLLRARQLAMDAGLAHVYLGNRPETGGEDSHCLVCQALLIARQGYRIVGNHLRDGCCPHCQHRLAGVWK